MKESRNGWITGLVFILVLIAAPVWYFTRNSDTEAGQTLDLPQENLPQRFEPVNHSTFFAPDASIMHVSFGEIGSVSSVMLKSFIDLQSSHSVLLCRQLSQL